MMNNDKYSSPSDKTERPISPVLRAVDNDLARDNLEDEWNLTAVDEQDV